MSQEVLKQCTVIGNVVKLPDGQLDRKVYTDVKKVLELIGGKWKGGKVYGFEFNEDPTDLLAQIAGGEKRNLKKEFQFFGTPMELARELVERANPNDSDRILEPSAGQGAIIKAVDEYCEPLEVYAYELMPLNQSFLGKIDCCTLLGEDFLSAPENDMYDVIIANPPFTKNQDIDHITKMWSVLAPKGRLVTVCSKHFQMSSNKKEMAFKNWLNEVGADIEEVPAGAFKESGTNIPTVIITINKPA